MSNVDVERLRTLRRRATDLLATLSKDLTAFQHSDPKRGFVRRPGVRSVGKDTNVTTSCSCLMGLALSGEANAFYKDNGDTARTVFWNLVEAPWMSSGLAENNAFTTALVIRTFGLFVRNALLKATDATTKTKAWELELPIRRPLDLAAALVASQEPLSRFVFDLFLPEFQTELRTLAGPPAQVLSGDSLETFTHKLARELDRIARTTSLRSDHLLEAVTLQNDTKRDAKTPKDAYRVVALNRQIIHEAYHEYLAPPTTLSLQDIARDLAGDAKNFRINEYPAAAAVVYWFVDGVHHGGIELTSEQWKVLCLWASSEFTRQRSLVVARHAAMMDPVSMGMAACLCARLRTITAAGVPGTTSAHQTYLPSIVELEKGVLEVFDDQTLSGIWPKYFPLFHYQEAGSNFCFTFELLEAVLAEFGSLDTLFGQDRFLEGLHRATTWCEENRLEFALNDNEKFCGWNSGGFFETLQKGQPESWATAVVHMFLWELVNSLSQRIQASLTAKYQAKRKDDWKTLPELLDIDLWIDRKPARLKQLLGDTIVTAFKGEDADSLRKKPKKRVPLSALLFGPPGTSKTEICKAVAASLGWPLVEIDPSHFLRRSYQNIYVEAEHIFDDVMDLSGVVVLFDEMDALVQKRDGQMTPDTEGKFLTTYMLPKLAKLHDRGTVVFFMATNFQASFDDAIKRAGRFDFLLCMGPPTLDEKCDNIHAFFDPDAKSKDKPTNETILAGKLIKGYCARPSALWLRQQLGLYTFGEFKSFITGLGDKTNIGASIKALGRSEFEKKVKNDSVSAGLKWSDLTPVLRLYKVSTLSELDRKQLDVELLKKKRVDVNKPIVRYVLDRQQSRRQSARLKSEPR